MTVNELIEALLDTGDKKFRDLAKVRLIIRYIDDECSGCYEPDKYDIHYTTNTVDIGIH